MMAARNFNSMGSNDESLLGAPSSGSSVPAAAGAQAWVDSILGILGVDKCCAIASSSPGFQAQQDIDDDPSHRPAAAAAPRAAPAPTAAAAGRKEGAGKKDPGEGGWFGRVKVALGGKSEAEKRRTGLEGHIALLKEGGFFTRRLERGKAPSPVWLQLTVSEDGAEATIEWRSPQLILNRPVNKDGIALDACRGVKEVDHSHGIFFATGAPSPDEVAKCFAVEAGRRVLVFEANSAKEGEAWRAAFAEALSQLVPDLHEKMQARLADERRREELEARRASRDTRRAEYAKVGMKHTANAMLNR